VKADASLAAAAAAAAAAVQASEEETGEDVEAAAADDAQEALQNGSAASCCHDPLGLRESGCLHWLHLPDEDMPFLFVHEFGLFIQVNRGRNSIPVILWASYLALAAIAKRGTGDVFVHTCSLLA
jgi:hypothetical protein